MNPAEELNLVEQQIHTLNQAQAAYPAKGELLDFRLIDPKKIYSYEVTDTLLDLYLDSLILHQVTSDDWKCKVFLKDELIIDCNISRECFDKIKRVLDAAEDIQ